MPLRMDSKAVIVAMIDAPGTFPTATAMLERDLAKYLASHFKDKSMGLDRLRATHGALGDEDLALALEALDDKAVAALLKKVDPHRTVGEPGGDLAHLKGLAGGGGEPQPKPKPDKPKKAPATTAKAPALTRAGADRAASAKGSGARPTGSLGTEEPSPPKTGRSGKRSPSAKKATSDEH